MRIIGGEYRGRKIKQPPFGFVRPTKDRIREAVFNMIAEKTPGSVVLDLFAGSGAYGLEGLSRGAQRVVFVEGSAKCARILGENITDLGVRSKTSIIVDDAAGVVKDLSERGDSFDIIFADPPYDKDLAKKILIIINYYDILKPSGLLIIEHSRLEALAGVEGRLSVLKQKTYRNTVISVLIKNDKKSDLSRDF